VCLRGEGGADWGRSMNRRRIFEHRGSFLAFEELLRALLDIGLLFQSYFFQLNPMVGGLTARSSNPRICAAENLAAFEDDFAPPAKPVGLNLNIGTFAAALPSFLLFQR